MKINIWHNIEQRRHFKTWHKLICVEKKQKVASLVNIYGKYTFFTTLNWINCAAKLYSWPLTFHKVVWQQIWGEVVVLIPSSSADPFWN